MDPATDSRIEKGPCKYWNGTPMSCRRGQNCHFFHAQPILPNDRMLVEERKPCRHWNGKGGCRNGNACPFLHSENPNSLRPCRYGSNCNKPNCGFSHQITATPQRPVKKCTECQAEFLESRSPTRRKEGKCRSCSKQILYRDYGKIKPIVVSQIPSLGPKTDKFVRLIFISDTHDCHSSYSKKFLEIPNFLNSATSNILFHCGDWTNYGNQKNHSEFIEWICSEPISKNFKYKFVISGNHERVCGDTKKYQNFHLEMKNQFESKDPTVKYFIYETLVLKEFGNLSVTDTQIPSNKTHILFTHLPPYGILDLHKSHRGSNKVTHLRERITPNYHVFGHVHRSGKTGSDIMERASNSQILSVNTAKGITYLDFYY